MTFSKTVLIWNYRTNGVGRKLSLNKEIFFFTYKQYQRIVHAKKKNSLTGSDCQQIYLTLNHMIYSDNILLHLVLHYNNVTDLNLQKV